MNPVNIVTVKNKIPLFKDEEIGERIELIQLEEIGFEIVSQKGLYEVGDKAVYIQPDYCLPNDSELFESFTSPGGDPNKSRLGKNNRIKALKFNFHIGDNQTVYSMGILLPKYEVDAFLDNINQVSNLSEDELYENAAEYLGITKYEEPEVGSSGQQAGDMPIGMYKTDENNFENIVNKIKFPVSLVGTQKIDGSSLTAYINHEGKEGICARNHEKKLDQSIIIGYTDINGNSIQKQFNKELKIRGWSDGLNFYEYPEESWIPIMGKTEDSWVRLGTPILDKIREYCKDYNTSLAIRGEIVGQGLKGSGNKNNPNANDKQKFYCFGIDDYSTGITRPLPFIEAQMLCLEFDIEYVPIIFGKEFNSLEELRKECEDYFKSNMIEGIVLRDMDSNFSAKYMNKEYDSKK